MDLLKFTKFYWLQKCVSMSHKRDRIALAGLRVSKQNDFFASSYTGFASAAQFPNVTKTN